MSRIIILLALVTLIANANAQKSAVRDPLVMADSLFLAGNFKMAAPQYERALRGSANATAQAWFRLGNSYHNLKDYSKAIDAYRKAEKINARFPGLGLNIARVSSASGDVKSAAVMMDSALARGFVNYKILDSDPELSNLRADASFASIRKRAYDAAHPCENLPAARQFDFWLGEWDVYPTMNPNVKAGVNIITKRSGGCVIMENWESQGPHEGVSINYFDPVNGKWQQKWAGSGQDIIEFYDGEFSDGAMRFKWDVPASGNTPAGMGRLTFSDLGPNKVRQHSEQSLDAGKTWTTVYDFTYVKR